ncbi:MAG: hypothetical protein ABI204_03160 [Ginsengibacter sp.]
MTLIGLNSSGMNRVVSEKYPSFGKKAIKRKLILLIKSSRDRTFVNTDSCDISIDERMQKNVECRADLLCNNDVAR